MSKSNTQMTGDASRGKKTLRATGVDNSSYGATSGKNINSGDKMKGSATDLSHSTSAGKAPTR